VTATVAEPGSPDDDSAFGLPVVDLCCCQWLLTRILAGWHADGWRGITRRLGDATGGRHHANRPARGAEQVAADVFGVVEERELSVSGALSAGACRCCQTSCNCRRRGTLG
jgi:hypothetical protein